MAAPRRFVRYLLLDTLALMVLLVGFVQQKEKATPAVFSVDAPPTVQSPVATQSALRANDVIRAINHHAIANSDELEFYCDGFAIGDSVQLDIDRAGIRTSIVAPLGEYYHGTYLVIILLTSFVFCALGIAVILKKPGDETARLFHMVMILAAMIVMCSRGRYSISPLPLCYAVQMLFGISMAMFAAKLVQFTFVFPERTGTDENGPVRTLNAVAWLLGAAYAATFLFSVSTTSHEWIARHVLVNDIIHWFFVACLLCAIVVFVRTYNISPLEIRRRKLRWVLAGFLVGPLGIALLYFAPNLLFGAPLIGEDWMTALAGLSAILFAVGIVRNQVLDIEFIVTRGTVYGIVLVALGAVYAIVVAGLVAAIGAGASSGFPTVIASLLVATLFTPVRTLVQKFVDTKFYRVQYDFREAQRSYIDELSRIMNVEMLAELLVQRTNELIPMERIAFFTMSTSGERLKLEAHIGFDLIERHGVAFDRAQLRIPLTMPVAREATVEPGLDVERADSTVFDRWGLAVVFPMRSEGGAILGFLVLGKKKSGARFSIEDVDLLTAVTLQAGLTLDRIRLQEALLDERAESQRLGELNALKSYFVSSVSHELKTPLTSIRMFAELLADQPDLPREKACEYLGIIEGESARLARLIDNVLDFAKIERGTKTYTLSDVNINELVAHVLLTMEYQFKMNKFTVETTYDPNIKTIHADADAIAEGLINLLSNAIKFSGERKHICIDTQLRDGHVAITVRDQGIGISREDLEHIFEPFFRSSQGDARRAGGTGLGLALVKHIMDAHGGRVEVESSLGSGTLVSLLFLRL